MSKSLESLMMIWDRIQKNQPSPIEYATLKTAERKRQVDRFEEALYYVTLRQFGAKYVGVHSRELTTSLAPIEENIALLFAQGIGGFYSSDPGGGKTHILLEIFIQISRLMWEEHTLTHDYPDASTFIEKTCHYIYAGSLYKLLENKERIPLAKINMIDDLGLGRPLPYVMTGIECYFEEINRAGHSVVVTSNLSKNDLLERPEYGPIGSRLCEKCNFYELGSGDRRKMAGAHV